MGKEARAPLLGYLDAPFFTDIDRRNADFDLPLNEMLMNAAAEACASAALTIIQGRRSVSHRAVFDLIAWTGDHAPNIDGALKGLGSSLCEAPIIPAIPVKGQEPWASLSEISLWPNGAFSVLRPAAVGRLVGARFVSPELDQIRINRLQEMAKGISRFSLTPTDEQIADWAEAFAQSLMGRSARPTTWSRFYEDLKCVFEEAYANLRALSKRSILFDRLGKLRPAGPTSQGAVYVRSEASKVRRSKGEIPLPPSTLMRRYRFLHESIALRRETLDAFINADLMREYDPVEALAGLKTALGASANDKQRREALLWSFQVWRAAGTKVEDELRDAQLYVPTLSGWRPAAFATFSSSWTKVGQELENYLVEAEKVSGDCRIAREMLLVGSHEWLGSSHETKQDWVRFLELTGVSDGLQPIPGRVESKGSPAYDWYRLLQRGKASEGLDENWCAEVARVFFKHRFTEYQRRGEAWRFPGQLEYDKFPETAREAFSALVFEHLKAHGDAYFVFTVGRFDRPNERDPQTLPTPLATFLRSKRWIAANTREGPGFRLPKECWAALTRGPGPPRFVDRVPDSAADLGRNSEAAQIVFSRIIGLRDWQSKETAVDRLRDLAMIATDLASNDRPKFRQEYQRAWLDIVETSAPLPADLNLVVTRRGQLEVLSGEKDKRLVFVAQDAQRLEARVLSSAGKAVLEVGENSSERVAALLKATGRFLPRRLDGIGVQLLVDGEAFAVRVADPLLTSLGLDWLPEVAVIGHELLGEQLERRILSSTVERKTRSIRVRQCEEISLVVDEDDISPTEHIGYYAFQHENVPTLILTNAVPLNWKNLARSLSDSVSRLIDSRLRSLERLLSRLALDRLSEELDAPSDEELARALECSVQTVQEHRAALRADLKHVLHMLIPVVAYYGDADLASQLRADADRTAGKFDAETWLKSHLDCMEYSPKALLDVCAQVADRTELRRQLQLDYGRFNRVLIELGEPVLSNEARLRQIYEAYLARMRAAIIERLRRHHYEDFRNGRDLATYVERKSLAFLRFNSEWILTREALDMAAVEEYVSRLLEEALGKDIPVELALLNRVIEMNRKSVQKFVGQAIPVIRAWCRKHSVSIPEFWRHADPQVEIVLHLENSGLLDFEPIALGRMPSLFRRTACWPDDMSETVDRTTLDLEEGEVEKEETRREQERQRLEIARRSIVFGRRPLDTGDPAFAENLRQLAEDWLCRDETWFERSRQRVLLIEVQYPEHRRSSGGGKGRAIRKRERQLTDTQREAMGLAGEWLALQFLRRRHIGYVDETCWVSQNRTRFFGGDRGDDATGYDFRVNTPQAEWLYEVKSSLEDNNEFELTANELQVASRASKDGRRRYRILYIPYVFSPDKWYVLELPNPMGERTHNQFQTVGRGSVRLRFERR